MIVAASLDESSERIVSYLSEQDIPINVLCFEVLSQGADQFLSRAWLLDPVQAQTSAAVPKPGGPKEPWNGEFYVSFGDINGERSWQDAVQYGFVAAGGAPWAEKWGLVERSPAQGIALLREPPPRDVFLSPEECRRLLAACDAEPNVHAAALFKLAMFTGRRIGELLRARWADVNLERQVLAVPVAKAGERQFVFLNDAALAVLRGLPRLQGNPHLIAGERPGQALVFYHPAWRRVLRRADLAYFPPHGLRHSYASTLVADGVPIETVGHLLGHKSSVTTRRYTHHRPDQLLRATQRFASVVADEQHGRRVR